MPAKTKSTKHKKPGALAAGAEQTIARRLHELRKLAGVSQEAMGAQGFVSAPGWIKMENGQRSPSEKLLTAFVAWLIKEKMVRLNQKPALLDELCALKYASHGNAFSEGNRLRASGDSQPDRAVDFHRFTGRAGSVASDEKQRKVFASNHPCQFCDSGTMFT